MAAPVRPPKLDPDVAYVHISSLSPPSDITDAIRTKGQCHLSYIGPIGELKGEHIFEVRHRDRDRPLQRSSVEWAKDEKSVLEAVKGVEGVKGAKMLDVKQRAKRNEF